MIPYLAIIKDSFREALASRVLLVLVGVITLILLGIAPTGIVQKTATTLRRIDIQNVRALVATLVTQGKSDEPSPGQALWRQLSRDLRRQLDEIQSSNESKPIRDVVRDLRNEFNSLLNKPDFYDKIKWGTIVLDEEARELIKRTDPLSNQEVARKNRLLIGLAFPGQITRAPDTTSHFVYGWFYESDALPLTLDQVGNVVQSIVSAVMTFVVGMMGIFVAILATSMIVPRAFESGSVDLLLSKPISRSLMFLSKFVGGCAFTLLNASYFIVGIWLILGLRFENWNSKLLLSIPLFLFIFAIYYSVSALAGVIWKNAIVSVSIAVLFWGICMAIGVGTVNVIEIRWLNPGRIANITPTGAAVLMTNKTGETFEWQEKAGVWEQVFVGPDAGGLGGLPAGFVYPMIGPIYDSKNDQLIAIETTFSLGALRRLQPPAGKLVVGRRDDDWGRIKGVAAPEAVVNIFLNPDNQIVVAGSNGVHIFKGNPAVEHIPFKVFGIDMGKTDDAGKFVEANGQNWARPFFASMNPQTGAIVIYSAGQVARLDPVGEKYVEVQRVDLETIQPAVIAFADGAIFVAFEDGEVKMLDAKTLAQKKTFRPFGKSEPRGSIVSPDGKWVAILTHSRHLWLYDVANDVAVESKIRGQGDISAAMFTRDGKFDVADHFTRITRYSLKPWKSERVFDPPDDLLKKTYHWVLKPLYTIFPKPSDQSQVISYLLTDQESVVATRSDDLTAERFVLDIWGPLWSNLAFLVVVLAITCLYISRRDF